MYGSGVAAVSSDTVDAVDPGRKSRTLSDLRFARAANVRVALEGQWAVGSESPGTGVHPQQARAGAEELQEIDQRQNARHGRGTPEAAGCDAKVWQRLMMLVLKVNCLGLGKALEQFSDLMARPGRAVLAPTRARNGTILKLGFLYTLGSV